MAPRPLPCFSKILLNPSAPHLPLPHAFVRKHLEKKIPENPILRSVNGGYSWRLKIKQVGENYCFVNGWKEVVEDSQLGYGDFLVFWLVDPSTFKLSIYSPSGCEKDFPVENHDVNQEEGEEEEEAEKVDDKEEYEKEEEKEYEEVKEEEEDDDIYHDGGGGDEEEDDDGGGCGGDEEEDDDGGGGGGDEEEDDNGGGDVNVDGDEGDPFFTKIMTKSHSHSMRFPLEFALLAGLDRERIVTVKNLEGKEWQMGLKLDSHHYIRYYLSAGWSKFRQDNELLEGYECVFKFIKSEDKFCLAKVIKEKDRPKHPTDKPQAAQVLKRSRSRSRSKKPAGKAPAVEVLKRPRGRPRRADMVEKKVVSGGKVAAGEVLKRPRGRPPRVKAVEKKVRSKKSVEVFKRPRGRPRRADMVEKKVVSGEVLKRPRGRPPRVKVVEKKVRSNKSVGKAPAGEIVKRKRGRPPRVEVVKEDDGAEVVKRPRGRPFKRKRGRPSSVGVVKKDDDANVVKRPRGRPFKRKRGPAAHVKL